MRGIFSVVGLLIALAIVGLLAKKQLGTQVTVPSTPGMPAVSADAPPQVQSQQAQQQVKQAVEGALQQARPMPEEK
jgi:multidrug efflux pump subunit AcrB